MYEDYRDWISKFIEESKPIKKSVWKSLPKIETRGDRIVKLLYMSAEDANEINIPTQIWYHVYGKDGKQGYGFAVKNGIITDHPEKRKIGNQFNENLQQYINLGIEIVKVSEQILL